MLSPTDPSDRTCASRRTPAWVSLGDNEQSPSERFAGAHGELAHDPARLLAADAYDDAMRRAVQFLPIEQPDLTPEDAYLPRSSTRLRRIDTPSAWRTNSVVS